MYTPMLGGAEAYLKDLLWNVDRERFEPIFFYESWPDFEEFLELERCPSIELRAVKVIEPSGHTHVDHAKPVTGGSDSDLDRQNGAGSTSLKSKLKQVYRNTPYGLTIASQGLKWLNYSLWRSNKARLESALRERPVDILHIVNGGYPGATTANAAAVVARKLGIRCVMTICSTSSPRNFPQTLEQRIDELVLASVDAFVIPADLPGQSLVEHRKFDSAKFRKIYFGVDAPEPPTDDKRLALETRIRLRIPADAFVVGTVSRFSRLKGQEHLIDAMALLRSRVPNLRAVLVGDGPTRAEMTNRAARKGVGDMTTFTGFYEDLFGALAAFDIFVLPSELEGVPYVVLQAMSQARPIVATNVGGIPEAIISGESGLLVSPRDPLALAEAIETLVRDREMAVRMGRNAYARFKQNFTVKRMIDQHECLYEQLVNV